MIGDDKLVVIGGVGAECPPPGCAVVDLNTQHCVEHPLPVSQGCESIVGAKVWTSEQLQSFLRKQAAQDMCAKCCMKDLLC